MPGTFGKAGSGSANQDPLLPSRLRWHFIGHLKNKIRHALPLFGCSWIDSLTLSQDMERIAAEEGLHRHSAGSESGRQASKHGFRQRRCGRFERPLGRLTVEGLMTSAFAPSRASRRYFVALRELRDQLETEFHVRLPQFPWA